MLFESFASAHQTLLWITFITALVMGAVVNRTNFCTMGAVSDMVNMGSLNRMRSWMLAMAVAIMAVTLLEYLGLVDADGAFPPYRSGQLVWAENLLGGVLFGIGMTLASGCGNKTLVRIGGGNLKSLVVMVTIALIAFYMVQPLPGGGDQTLFSLLFYDWIRPMAISLEGRQDIGALLAGEDIASARLIAGVVVAVALFYAIFRSRQFLRDKEAILAGLVVGVVIVIAWFISSSFTVEADGEGYSLVDYYGEWEMLAESDEGRPAAAAPLSPQSFTFINPMGQSYNYLSSGFDPALLTFGLVALIGVVLGSLAWSLISRGFRIEWFVDRRDLLYHLVGALLMGIGGVLAMGCTLGQGITGISTLAVGSFIALGGIVFGSAVTMRVQYYQLLHEGDATFTKALLSTLVDFRLLPRSMRSLEYF